MIGTVWLNGFFQEYFPLIMGIICMIDYNSLLAMKILLKYGLCEMMECFGSNGKNKQILDLNNLFWFITIQKFFVKNVGHYLKDLNIVIILTL